MIRTKAFQYAYSLISNGSTAKHPADTTLESMNMYQIPKKNIIDVICMIFISGNERKREIASKDLNQKPKNLLNAYMDMMNDQMLKLVASLQIYTCRYMHNIVTDTMMECDIYNPLRVPYIASCLDYYHDSKWLHSFVHKEYINIMDSVIEYRKLMRTLGITPGQKPLPTFECKNMNYIFCVSDKAEPPGIAWNTNFSVLPSVPILENISKSHLYLFKYYVPNLINASKGFLYFHQKYICNVKNPTLVSIAYIDLNTHRNMIDKIYEEDPFKCNEGITDIYHKLSDVIDSIIYPFNLIYPAIKPMFSIGMKSVNKDIIIKFE